METGLISGATIISLNKKTYQDIKDGKIDIKISTTNGIIIVDVTDDKDTSEEELTDMEEDGEAYDKGFDEGYDAGYADGYMKAKKEASYNGKNA